MSKRLMIIDDHEHLRFILKMTLEMHGYEVEEAVDGQAALDVIRVLEKPFDLIFCDIDMPVMHGVDFVRKYREEFGAATPIVMLSAETSDMLNAAMAAGATSTIAKPFEPADLLRALEDMLKA